MAGLGWAHFTLGHHCASGPNKLSLAQTGRTQIETTRSMQTDIDFLLFWTIGHGTGPKSAASALSLMEFLKPGVFFFLTSPMISWKHNSHRTIVCELALVGGTLLELEFEFQARPAAVRFFHSLREFALSEDGWVHQIEVEFHDKLRQTDPSRVALGREKSSGNGFRKGKYIGGHEIPIMSAAMTKVLHNFLQTISDDMGEDLEEVRLCVLISAGEKIRSTQKKSGLHLVIEKVNTILDVDEEWPNTMFMEFHVGAQLRVAPLQAKHMDVWSSGQVFGLCIPVENLQRLQEDFSHDAILVPAPNSGQYLHAWAFFPPLFEKRGC